MTFFKVFIRGMGLMSSYYLGLYLVGAAGFNVPPSPANWLVSLAGVFLWISCERDWGE